MAKKHKKQQTFTPQLVEMQRQLEEEDREQCMAIVAEFSAGAGPASTMQAMAKAILRYRYALQTLGITAVGIGVPGTRDAGRALWGAVRCSVMVSKIGSDHTSSLRPRSLLDKRHISARVDPEAW